uniref:Uncharacterized protein n=1 Tax=Podoviridae sp. ct8Lf7 TaxID=2827723 RepID=A0A8S5S138_9CAUD|nr:MAG TPA: hypothetical protein [Podoviridae sp. ct8Lf7]
MLPCHLFGGDRLHQEVFHDIKYLFCRFPY